MSQGRERHARNLVIMVAAGGDLADVLEMAQTFGVRAVHVQQLAVPPDEQPAQRLLTDRLRTNVN